MAKKKQAKKKGPNEPKIPGGVTGKGFVPGQSGNPSGRPKKFETLLSDAIRAQLGTISIEDQQTYASLIAQGMVEGAAKIAKKKRLTKELLIFFKEARDTTEGRPIQKVQVDGKLTTDPVERVKELLTRGAERSAQGLNNG